MQTAIYVIDLQEVSDERLISDYFFARVYGFSCFGRNLQVLRRSFSAVSVAVIGLDRLPSQIQEQCRLLAERLSFSIVSGPIDDLLVRDGQSLMIVYQSGLAMLTKFAPLDASDIQTAWESNRESGAPDRSLLESMRTACGKHGAQVILCNAFPNQRGQDALFLFLRRQEAMDVARLAPDLIAGVKRALEVRASQRSMDGPVSRLIVRHLCHLASKPLAAAGVHPNYVTLAGALFALFAVLLFLDGGSLALAAGGVCWLIGGILDEADGEVARLQGKESAFGSWLDLTLDRIFDAAMLLALVWPLRSSPFGDEYLIITLCALVAVSASSYTGLLYDSWMRSKDRHAYFRLGRDVRILIITLSAVFGFRMLPIVLCGAFAATEICRRFWVCWRVERSIAVLRD
ncbi:CDP-alcohol phosphatidyltransferase family protein [Rhizobium sp. SG570]|uniref:CDP-alcohol phosphatidyltransferase family protein n=1 Tax=Rhizobium sp. SG570 TaxID=2587113 RepID=UPI001445CFF7|nr:CDP-alcohol phosphatidyltransferase family protein [Rhizobium sp. SG570]NKJ39810.1 phosphatidylglycerophosphate synthase [Rhizobium sp. SG570]